MVESAYPHHSCPSLSRDGATGFRFDVAHGKHDLRSILEVADEARSACRWNLEAYARHLAGAILMGDRWVYEQLGVSGEVCHDEALVQIRRSLELFPAWAEQRLNIGVCLMQMRRFGDAAVELQCAGHLVEGRGTLAGENLWAAVRALFYRGECLAHLGRRDEAVDCAQRAQRLLCLPQAQSSQTEEWLRMISGVIMRAQQGAER